jgi:TetR/AcrR family transcriptional regulator
MLSAAGPQPARTDSPRTRRRGAQTAEQILDAAESCFARRGYAGTSLRDVADIVGIRIPSLYNHFPNKESLYAAVLERGMAPLLALLGAAIEDDKALVNPDLFVTEIMTLLGQRPDLPRLVQYELLAGGEHLAPILDSWLRPVVAQGLVMLESSAASERWRSDQLPSLLMAYFNIAVGYFTTAPIIEHVLGASPLAPESLARQTEFFGQLILTLTGSTPVGVPPASPNSEQDI